MLNGYKAFYNNMQNHYGMHFVEGETYSVEGPIEFGTKGNGFHFCKRLEDTLRYVPAMEEEVSIAEVTSLAEYVEHIDDYYAYYDLYVTRKLRIDRILSRKEIINMFLIDMDDDRIIRFVSGFKLTPEEIELFKLRYAENSHIIKAILYYQEGNKDVYNNLEKIKRRQKVDKYER